MVLLASEVAANAVVHARSPLGVTVEVGDDAVTVRDERSQFVCRAEPGPTWSTAAASACGSSTSCPRGGPRRPPPRGRPSRSLCLAGLADQLAVPSPTRRPDWREADLNAGAIGGAQMPALPPSFAWDIVEPNGEVMVDVRGELDLLTLAEIERCLDARPRAWKGRVRRPCRRRFRRRTGHPSPVPGRRNLSTARPPLRCRNPFATAALVAQGRAGNSERPHCHSRRKLASSRAGPCHDRCGPRPAGPGVGGHGRLDPVAPPTPAHRLSWPARPRHAAGPEDSVAGRRP